MKRPTLSHLQDPEAGGITILVVIMLLMLLTVSAVGMSRNAMREVMVAATARQGMEARNLADSGLEWSIHWINEWERPARDPGTEAKAFIKAVTDLGNEVEAGGLVKEISSTDEGPLYSVANGVTRKTTVRVMRMGELELDKTTSDVPGMKILKPLLWSIRTDASLEYTGGLAFQHSRESWVGTPPPGAASSASTPAPTTGGTSAQ